MSAPAPLEPLEAFPIPAEAVLVDPPDPAVSSRQLAVQALQQELRQRQLSLPLGPELHLADPERLLSLNRFALQLATAGLLADQIGVPQQFWQERGSAPQLLLAALVDEESGVVQFQGVLSGPELQPLLAAAQQVDGRWLLDVGLFRGGLDRLFTLVQLLEPDTLPRLALAGQPSPAEAVIAVVDWLQGRLDQALSALGGTLQPAGMATAFGSAAFRSAAFGSAAFGSAVSPSGLEHTTPLAVLSIPLGLTPEGNLVTGEAARACLETLQLLWIPSCLQSDGTTPDVLILQLTGSLSGDLLPDGISLTAVQGRLRQSASTEQSHALSFSFRGGEPIAVTLRAPNGMELHLPPVQLPQA